MFKTELKSFHKYLGQLCVDVVLENVHASLSSQGEGSLIIFI